MFKTLVKPYCNCARSFWSHISPGISIKLDSCIDYNLKTQLQEVCVSCIFDNMIGLIKHIMKKKKKKGNSMQNSSVKQQDDVPLNESDNIKLRTCISLIRRVINKIIFWSLTAISFSWYG